MYSILLLFHVFTGTSGLLTGLVAMLVRKGPGTHSLSGRFFSISMAACALSALIMCLIKFNPFLLAISLFTLYMLQAGLRSIVLWKSEEVSKPVFRDYLPLYIGFPLTAFMIGFPIFRYLAGQGSLTNILLFFGLIMLSFLIQDVRLIRDKSAWKPYNKQWLRRHIGMMGGTYIAAFTAFAVNNIHVGPAWLSWMLPSVLGGMLIQKSMSKFKLVVKS